MNTSYVFTKASQRKRKKNITSLEEEGVLYEDNESMLKYVTSFYKKKFFRGESKENIHLGGSFWGESEKVTHEVNITLEGDFSEEEIKKLFMALILRGLQGQMSSLSCFTRSSGGS
jgi:hypothetical protein